MIHVAVCITTFLRPLGLARCLESLNSLTFQHMTEVAPSIIVVDNDILQSARSIVQDFAKRSVWPVKYVAECQRGISFARNRAVVTAQGHRYIAFVDDDEYVDPVWLDELLYAQSLYAADIVAGPVRPEFERAPPNWITQGRFFDRPRWASGTQLDSASTANVLARMDILESVPGPFDVQFARSGGEDAALFTKLARMGVHLVWTDNALVHETVPESRMTVRWVIRREYRKGNTLSLLEKTIAPELRRSRRRMLRQGRRTMRKGAKQLIESTYRKDMIAVAGLAQVANGLGGIAGVLGLRYEEYRSIHGS